MSFRIRAMEKCSHTLRKGFLSIRCADLGSTSECIHEPETENSYTRYSQEIENAKVHYQNVKSDVQCEYLHLFKHFPRENNRQSSSSRCNSCNLTSMTSFHLNILTKANRNVM